VLTFGCLKQIEKGESKIQKRQEFMNAVKRKVEKYANPWQQLKFQYGNAKVGLGVRRCMYVYMYAYMYIYIYII
jgi:hypothetical protein